MTASNHLPDFIVIGAAKSGTSTLYGYLCLHPDVFMCTPKEPCFFDEAVSWGKGLDWYRGLFAGARDGQILGEASTNYARYPQVDGVVDKIHGLVPQVKLILLMRDPVQRTYSHFVHRWSKETHPGEPFTVPFRAYIEQDRMCIDSSDYALQLDRYLERFGREQVLLLTFEQLMGDRPAVLAQLGGFLGLDGLERFADVQVHEGDTGSYLADKARTATLLRLYAAVPLLGRARHLLPRGLRRALWDRLPGLPFLRSSIATFSPPPMSDEDRAYLRAYFEPRNRDLALRYGVDVSKWGGDGRR